jgi:hypothetical protein
MIASPAIRTRRCKIDMLVALMDLV